MAEFDLAKFLDDHGDGLLVAERSGHLSYASAPAAKVFGYSHSDLRSMPLWQLHPAFDETEICASLDMTGAYEIVIGGGDPNRQSLFRVCFQSDRERGPILVSMHNLDRLDGAPAKHSFEEDLRTRSLEAIGKVTAKLGHDFNNLLGSMLGCIDIMKSRLDKQFPESNPVARQVSIIESALGKAIGLSSRIRGFARPGPLHLVRGSLKSCVDSVVQLLEQNGVTRSEIDVNLSSDPPIDISEHSVCQILIAICLNSLEAMKDLPDRQVIIYLEEVELNETITRYLTAGKYARLSVMDHGVGIPSHVRDQLFEPFVSTKEGVGKGLGLSLAMAREVMKKHGGDLFLLSEPECGTVVHLYFPIAG